MRGGPKQWQKKRRRFSARFQFKVALEAEREAKTLFSPIARRIILVGVNLLNIQETVCVRGLLVVHKALEYVVPVEPALDRGRICKDLPDVVEPAKFPADEIVIPAGVRAVRCRDAPVSIRSLFFKVNLFSKEVSTRSDEISFFIKDNRCEVAVSLAI